MDLVLGLGCDRNTELATIKKAVELALEKVEAQRSDVKAIATIDKKSDEVGLLELAESFGLELVFHTSEELAKVDVPNPSEVVFKYMGTGSVSEAAAILAGDCSKEELILEKLKHKGDDGKNATVSIVQIKKYE